MAESFQPRPITPDGVEAALDRADHYRLLGQPEQAQSICHDVLAIDPGNQRAMVTLALALSDQFAGSEASVRQAMEMVGGLGNDYQRCYYTGIVAERHARAMLGQGPNAAFAYHRFREAMDWFEQAIAIRPEGNDDAILRWNACVRTIASAKLHPRPPETELGLE